MNKEINNYIRIIKPEINKKNTTKSTKKNTNDLYSPLVGLYDPLGININPFTSLPYENLYQNDSIDVKSGPLVGQKIPKTYKNLAYSWTNLKVYEFLNPILKSIKENQITMVKAGTGVGKTVLVPKIALQAFNFQKKVVCTVPKQIIANKNAKYSAECLDVALGQEVGYFYMGDNHTSEKTKLIFTTPGSLKSKITGGDPNLDEYSCIIIDEIHERSVQTDQLLLFMKDILEKRPELRVILMSATIDLSKFKTYFAGYSYNEIEILGKSFSVDVTFEKAPLKNWQSTAVNLIHKILTTTDEGDILVFIKSGGDGKMLCQDLERKMKNSQTTVKPFCTILEAKSSPADRDLAVDEFAYKSLLTEEEGGPYTRKVVMTTNVAESSLTVDGIVYVIDNGYSLESSYYPQENARSLIEERISKAAAEQRKGRAGRTRNGFCYRLYTEKEFEAFPDYPIPEIQKTDLTNDILDVLNYSKSVTNVKTFLNKLMAPPSNDFINSGLNKLYALGAITSLDDKGMITDMGNALAQFRAIESNMAKAILAGYYYNCARDVINIVLITNQIDSRMETLFEKYYPRDKRMSEKDIEIEKNKLLKKQKAFYSSYGDFFTVLNVYYALKDYMASVDPQVANARIWCKENGINPKIFVKRDYPKKDNRWDVIGEQYFKIFNTLIKIVRPDYLKKENFKSYKNDGGKDTLKMVSNNVNKKNKGSNPIIIDTDNKNIYETNNILAETNDILMQEAGFANKPYEINLFPNISLQNSKEKNIMMALSIGNICNTAKLINDKKGLYKTCFPEKKIYAGLDRSTTLIGKNRTKVILYSELFMRRKDEKILKLNMVSKIPTDIISSLKSNYGDFIKSCFTKEETSKNDIKKFKHKKEKSIHKGKYKEKQKKKFFKKK
jgi:HrpA-like RNA helicase